MRYELPAQRLRVAAANAASAPGQVQANVETAVSVVASAGARKVELLVFGELFLPGYHPPTWAAEPQNCDTSVDDSRLEPLRAAAVKHGVNVLVGASVPCGDQRYLGVLLVDTHGRARDVYHKQNLCGEDELRQFVPGTHGSTIVVNGWRLGVGVCYDAAFPEHARAAAADGCHAYLTGGAFVAGGEHRRDTYHRARALDNTFYVVFAGALGGQAPWLFSGGSAVFDPEGRSISQELEPAIVIGDLDPRVLRATRQDHTMLDDVAEGPSARHLIEM